jgi:hypothetical protein
MEISYGPGIESLKREIVIRYGQCEIDFSWLYGEDIGVPFKIRGLDGGSWEEFGSFRIKKDGIEISRIRLFHHDL